MLNQSSSDLDLDWILNVPSSSELEVDLDLQRFFEELEQSNDLPSPPPKSPPPPAPAQSPNILLDRAFLERQLDFECAAVASLRDSHAKPLISGATHADNNSQGQIRDVVGVASRGLSPEKSRTQVVVVALDSGEDENHHQQQMETTDHQNSEQVRDPAIDAKRIRRKKSNSDAARKSREKKEDEKAMLMAQVSQLRVENSSLPKRLKDAGDLYDKETHDNAALKAEVEMLRAKVKQAAETLKRIAISSKLAQPMPEMYSSGLPSFPAMPMQLDHPNQHNSQASSEFELPYLSYIPSNENGTLEFPFDRLL